MRRFSKGMCALVLGATLSTMSYSAFASVSRVMGGENRYSTAAKVAENGWKYGTNTVILVNGEAIVDALAATPYARYKDAPILLTQRDTIPAETRDVISKLGVSNVVIIGGEGVVSKVVVNQLENMSLNVERISGVNRYETSSAVAHSMSGVHKVAVVNGVTGLADALSVAAPAARDNMAIILSDGNKIISGQDIVENASDRYVIGGTGVVSDNLTNSISGIRLAGINRNATNAAVLNEFYPEEYINKVYIAKDGAKKQSELVDALAVGSLAGREGNPVMLLGNSLVREQENYLMPRLSQEVVQVGYGVPSNVANDVVGELNVIGLPKEDKNKVAELREVRAINGEVIATLTNSIDKAKLDDFYIVKSVDGGQKNRITPNRVELNDNKVDVSLKLNEEPRENWNKRINYEVKYKNGDFKSCWFKIIHEGKGPVLSVSEVPDIVRVSEVKLKVTAIKNDATSIVVSNNGTKYQKDKNGEYTVKLKEGSNEIVILGTNAKGDETKITKRVICDTTIPKITTSKLPAETYENILRFKVNIDEECNVVVKNGEYTAKSCGNGEYEVELGDGYNVISIQATDRAGNTSLMKSSVKRIVKLEATSAEATADVVKLNGIKGTSELGLMDRKITLIEEGTDRKLTATYIKNSYKNHGAEFKIDGNEKLQDAKKYKIEADWGDFSKCNLMAKLSSKKVDKLYVINQVLTVGDRTIKTETIDQYGDKLYLNKHENPEVKLKIDGNLVDIVQSGNDFRIVNPLQSGKEIKIQFFNNDKPISEVVKFTVREGEPSKQTKIENIKSYKYDASKKEFVEISSSERLSIGDKVKLTAEVKDQYGNTLTSDLAKIKWTNKSNNNIINVEGSEKDKGKVHERTDGLVFEIKDSGTIDILAEIDNKANQRFNTRIDYTNASELKFNVDESNKDKIYSNEKCRLGILEGNIGSKLTSYSVKYNKIDGLEVYPVQGTGDNKEKVFIDVKAKNPGKYTLKLNYGSLNAKDIVFEVVKNPEVRNININGFEGSKDKELELNEASTSEMKFTNRSNEELEVKASDIDIKVINDKNTVVTDCVECKLLKKDNSGAGKDDVVGGINFNVQKEGKYKIEINNTKYKTNKTVNIICRKFTRMSLNSNVSVKKEESVIIPLELQDNFNQKMSIDKFKIDEFKVSDEKIASLVYYKGKNGVYTEVTDKKEADGIGIEIKILKEESVTSKDINVSYNKDTNIEKATIKVKIDEERKVNSIENLPQKLTINIWEKKNINLTVKDQYGSKIDRNPTVSVKKENDILTVGGVNGGNGDYNFDITGKSEGNTSIVIKAGEKSIEIPVTVQDKSKVPNGITITCKEDLNKLYSTRDGERQFNFSATVNNSAGETITPQPSIKWSTSSKNATINDNGILIVSQNTKETITVTATADNGTYESVKIKVSNQAQIPQKGTMKLFLNGKEIEEGTELEIRENTTLKATAVDQYGKPITSVKFKNRIDTSNKKCEVEFKNEDIILKPVEVAETTLKILEGDANVYLNVYVAKIPNDKDILDKALASNETNIRNFFPQNKKSINITEIKINKDIDFDGLKIIGNCNLEIGNGEIKIKNLNFDNINLNSINKEITILNWQGKSLNINKTEVNIDNKSKIASITLDKKPAKIEDSKIVIDESAKPQEPSDKEKTKSNSEV